MWLLRLAKLWEASFQASSATGILLVKTSQYLPEEGFLSQWQELLKGQVAFLVQCQRPHDQVQLKLKQQKEKVEVWISLQGYGNTLYLKETKGVGQSKHFTVRWISCSHSLQCVSVLQVGPERLWEEERSRDTDPSVTKIRNPLRRAVQLF